MTTHQYKGYTIEVDVNATQPTTVHKGDLKVTSMPYADGGLPRAQEWVDSLSSAQKGAHTKKANAIAADVSGQEKVQEDPPTSEVLAETVATDIESMPLREKMLYVQRELAKTGVGRTASGSQYSTRSIDDLINTMSVVLTKARLILRPVVLGVERKDWTKKDGGILRHTLVHMDYVFLDADNDDADEHTGMHVPFYGEASDSLDKSLQKAITNAYKYMMIQTFNIPLVGSYDPDLYQDDPEVPADTVVVPQENGPPEVVSLGDLDLDGIYAAMHDPESKVNIPVEHQIEALIEHTGISKTRSMWDTWVKNEGLDSNGQLSALRSRDAAIVKETEEEEDQS